MSHGSNAAAGIRKPSSSNSSRARAPRGLSPRFDLAAGEFPQAGHRLARRAPREQHPPAVVGQQGRGDIEDALPARRVARAQDAARDADARQAERVETEGGETAGGFPREAAARACEALDERAFPRGAARVGVESHRSDRKPARARPRDEGERAAGKPESARFRNPLRRRETCERAGERPRVAGARQAEAEPHGLQRRRDHER